MHSALVKPAYAQNIKQANELVFGNWEYPVATFFAHRSPSLYVNFYSPMKHHSLSLVIGGRPRNCSAPLSLIFLSFFPFLYILHDDDNDAKHKSLIYSDLQWVWSLPSSLPKVHLSPDDQLQSKLCSRLLARFYSRYCHLRMMSYLPFSIIHSPDPILQFPYQTTILLAEVNNFL